MNETSLFVIGTLLTVIGALGLIVLNSMKETLAKAVDSISELNIEVAKVVKAVEYHEIQFNIVNDRIKKLEELKDD